MENSKKIANTGERIIKGSFWLISSVHIMVFTVIGIVTKEWRLLAIFLTGFVLTMVAYALFRMWLAKRAR